MEKTNQKQLRNTLMLVGCALIWGTAFVAQSVGSGYMGPYTFLASRSWLACAFLLGLLAVRRQDQRRHGQRLPFWIHGKTLAVGGALCGAALFVACNLQQMGMTETGAGKAGFITALYVVLVPVCGLFAGRRQHWMLWLGVGLAAVGLYLLCVTGGGLAIGRGDLLVLAGALGFTAHIIIIDHFSPKVDGVAMSCLQFAVASGLALVAMLLFEQPSWQAVRSAAFPLFYAGVFSCGMGYTLQIVGQKTTDPTVASLILCLESVFAVLFSWLLTGETLSPRELAGCALMFAAILLAQCSGTVRPKKAKHPAPPPQGEMAPPNR